MDAQPASSPNTDSQSFLGRHQFLIYRLFSLAGLMPIGGYLCLHLFVNATVLDSPATFQANVDKIHSLGIFLAPVEWIFIFIPIAFHATVGLIIIAGGLPNTGAYPRSANIRYTLQRATGMIALAFIIWHLIHMHYLFGAPFKGIGGAQFEGEHATSSAATAIQAALWIQILYAIGVISITYHFANGLWTQGITWGLWTTPAAQARASKVCLGFGLILCATGLGALYGMSKQNPSAARAIEDRMEQGQEFIKGQKSLQQLLDDEKSSEKTPEKKTDK